MSNEKTGQVMIYMAWILFLALLTFGFNNLLEKQNNPNQNVAHEYNDERIAEVRLKQNRQGHYVATGQINGKEVTFLLDTGATQISIPASVAEYLELEKGFPHQVSTANGNITVYATKLDTVSLGAIVLHDIKANINPFIHGDEILLGMNFMKHLEIIQRDKQLLLRQIP